MFDPYYKWLAIPPQDQPPSHYRLLSLPQFEKDLDVIEGAADRAMGFVRQYQSGEHAALAAKVLNEIAAARLCLLKPKLKADYDAQLKRLLAAKEDANDDIPSFADDAELATLVKASKPVSKRKKKNTKSSPANYLVGAGCVALFAIVVIVVSFNRGGKAIVKSDPAEQAVAPIVPAQVTPQVEKSAPVVAPMTAEQQLAEVSKKLQELNPGFDGVLSGIDGVSLPKVKDGIVTELKVITDNITDLSPVRALTGLNVLTCSGTADGAGKISDLSCLKGMKLKQLDCGMTQVIDLSPLAQLPLVVLRCNGTNVADMSCLRGVGLVELQLWSAKITDLSPLQGMPLKHVVIAGTQVKDLKPLQGMQLDGLSFDHCPVEDLSPLAGMPLTRLHCRNTLVSNLSPLRGMPLAELFCDQTSIFDLSPLAGMKLTSLMFEPRKIRAGIDVIRQMESLTTIGRGEKERFSRDEFWKRYDAGEFGRSGQ